MHMLPDIVLRIGIYLASAAITCVALAEDWPQAAGPNHNFVVEGNAPASFSVARNENIRWRTALPSTGQGTVIISAGRAFVTSHEVLDRDTETGSTILGMCFDTPTGKELWRREVPGRRITDLSSLFSDNTAASPVSDGQRVCFTNVGGTVACFNIAGTPLWTRTWTMFGRHHSRQHEPILHGGNVILMHVPRNDLPRSATTKAGAQPLGRGRDVWSYLQAYDLRTGKRRWTADCGTSVHTTSLLGRLPDDDWCILTGRGGGHQPPEEPYGVSLVTASDGRRAWDADIKGYPAAQNASWNEQLACLFVGREHRTLDIKTGRQRQACSLVDDVTVCRIEDESYVTREHQRLPKLRKAITNQSNCLVGDYHYFLAHDDFLIGRVQIWTGAVEYLQVPVQVIRAEGRPDELIWRQARRNDMRNAAGFLATQDRRNAGSGWGHVSAASPTVIGERIYFPTMIGMVYVVDWNAARLDESALVSISDLGPAGETWSLSSLSFADGNIYARTLKELICIGLK